MIEEEQGRGLVCPYCGAPNSFGAGVCRACGSDLEANRVVFDPIAQYWQMGRALRRRPVPGEPLERLVRAGLFMIGLFLFLPSFFSLVLMVSEAVSGTASPGALGLLMSGGGSFVGGVLCCRAVFWSRKFK
ncbi:MAG: hypothetical protein AB1374_07500 [Bacillota bacterium]